MYYLQVGYVHRRHQKKQALFLDSKGTSGRSCRGYISNNEHIYRIYRKSERDAKEQESVRFYKL
jgi:Mor family transcriptional regulator